MRRDTLLSSCVLYKCLLFIHASGLEISLEQVMEFPARSTTPEVLSFHSVIKKAAVFLDL